MAVLIVGAIFAAPSSAQADSSASYGCTSYETSGLHMTATRIRYTSGGTAIYASATQSFKQVRSLKPDVTWTFNRFEGAGLQTRRTQPTQWGSPTNPLPTYARYIYVYWHGVDSQGRAVATVPYCRATVGR